MSAVLNNNDERINSFNSKVLTIEKELNLAVSKASKNTHNISITKDMLNRAVEYATRRFWMRNKGKPKPSCFTCRGTKSPAGHDTASCPITLLRCRNGAIDEATVCGTHPDGVHTGSACKGGKKRTDGGRKHINRDPKKFAAAQLAAARKLVADTDGPTADAIKQKHMHAFLAIPHEQREALLSFMQS